MAQAPPPPPPLPPPLLFLHTAIDQNLDGCKAWQRGYIEYLSEACNFHSSKFIFGSLSCTDELVACADMVVHLPLLSGGAQVDLHNKVRHNIS